MRKLIWALVVALAPISPAGASQRVEHLLPPVSFERGIAKPEFVLLAEDAEAPVDEGHLVWAADGDADPEDELIFAELRGATWSLTLRDAIGLTPVWMIDLGDATETYLAVGDLDGAPGDEVSTYTVERTSDGMISGSYTFTLSMWDVEGGALRWSRHWDADRTAVEPLGFPLVESMEGFVSAPIIGFDVTGDGLDDILVVNGSAVATPVAARYEIQGWLSVSSADGSDAGFLPAVPGSSIAYPVRDVSDDGKADIAVLARTATDMTLSVASADGSGVHWSRTVDPGYEVIIESHQLDGVGPPDVMMIHDGTDTAAPRVIAFNGFDGSIMWNRPFGGYQGTRLFAAHADIDGDGGIDILDLPWGDRVGRITALSGKTLAPIWTTTYPSAPDSYFFIQARGLLDDDPITDMIVGDWRMNALGRVSRIDFLAFSGTGALMWGRDVTESQLLYGPLLMPLDLGGGPGQDLASPMPYSSLTSHILAIDGETGEDLWSSGALPGGIYVSEGPLGGRFSGSRGGELAWLEGGTTRSVAVSGANGVVHRTSYA